LLSFCCSQLPIDLAFGFGFRVTVRPCGGVSRSAQHACAPGAAGIVQQCQNILRIWWCPCGLAQSATSAGHLAPPSLRV
jgi:hypothetical protein